MPLSERNRRWVRAFGWRGRGVAQGSPISPLLSNIYLHPFDRLMSVAGWRVVRFADDFVVLTASEKQARLALRDTAQLLRGRGLALNQGKTSIISPDTPFKFIGIEFIAAKGSMPSPAEKQLDRRVTQHQHSD